MTDPRAACSPQAFEARYRCDPDPWSFASSPYEQNRYDLTVAALARQRFGQAFEPGCSVGELTVRLAMRCDRVFACDVSPTAVARARARCARSSNVEVLCADIEAGRPAGPVDLVVFSEIGYYFPALRLAAVVECLVRGLLPGGEFIAVHWLGHSPDHVLHGEEVHRIVGATPSLAHRLAQRHDGFLIDSWVKR